MSLEIQIGEPASAELAEAARWYEAERPGLGAELLNEVSRSLAILADHPEIGPVFSKNARVRYVPLGRFPYRVIYRLHDDRLVIVAFAHTSRRPGYWRGRI